MSLKDILTNLTVEKRLDEEQLACLYSKDIVAARRIGSCERETLEEILQERPNEEEVADIINRRESQEKFPNDAMFRKGEQTVVEEMGKIKNALMKKDGIVSVEEQDLFREQLERTF